MCLESQPPVIVSHALLYRAFSYPELAGYLVVRYGGLFRRC